MSELAPIEAALQVEVRVAAARAYRMLAAGAA